MAELVLLTGGQPGWIPGKSKCTWVGNGRLPPSERHAPALFWTQKKTALEADHGRWGWASPPRCW